MRTVMHLNLRVDPTQYVPQIRKVPKYDYVHLVRQPKYMVDMSLLNENVYYLSEIHSPEDYVKENNISLMHAHHGQLGILLLPFKEKTQLPLVTSIRGRDATMANQPVGYLEGMKKLFDQGEAFYPVCNHLAERINDWGCPPEKIKVLYGGVDLTHLKYRRPPQRETQNILSMGRLVEKKGHHILMKAFQKIRNKYPNATLTIVGKGELEKQLKTLATQLNLGESFQLLPHLPKEKVKEQMTRADVFCAASMEATNGDVEGIPNTVKEAMAVGVPVVSTYHAGIPELVTNHENGILVEENNVNELAEGLEYMLENRNLWPKLTLAARNNVQEKFDQRKQLLLQSKYYTELVGG